MTNQEKRNIEDQKIQLTDAEAAQVTGGVSDLPQKNDDERYVMKVTKAISMEIPSSVKSVISSASLE